MSLHRREEQFPTVLVTASYRGDFERCRLLCDSIDRHVEGHTRHLILVEGADVPLFKALAGPRREIVDERDLLPFWIRPFPDPVSFDRRRIWLSPFGPPLRGWHIQQVRRIAIAEKLPEKAIISLDSDVVFLRKFEVSELFRDGRVAFHRVPDAHRNVLPDRQRDHLQWSRKAGALLGIERPESTTTGYIGTLIAWRTDTTREMIARLQDVSGRSWFRAVLKTRKLSECTLYGRFVDEVEGRPDRHFPSETHRCKVYWAGRPLDREGLAAFIAALGPDQVAAGFQSFTNTDIGLIRQAAGLT